MKQPGACTCKKRGHKFPLTPRYAAQQHDDAQMRRLLQRLLRKRMSTLDVPRVHADAVQIEELLVKPLRNSVEAMTKAKSALNRIGGSYLRHADMIEVVLCDNGAAFHLTLPIRHQGACET